MLIRLTHDYTIYGRAVCQRVVLVQYSSPKGARRPDRQVVLGRVSGLLEEAPVETVHLWDDRGEVKMSKTLSRRAKGRMYLSLTVFES